MKVFVTAVGETELVDLLRGRAKESDAHELVDTAEAADLILLAGSFGQNPQLLLAHPCYRNFADRCAVYTEDDSYLPLAPGVYCSAHLDESHLLGRIFSYTYVSRNGQYSNSYLAENTDANRDQAPGLPALAAMPKKYLFTFQGASTSLLRKRLFKLNFQRSDVLIENTSSYFHWDDSQSDRRDRQRTYAETLAASNFVLCPRGAGAGSIRLFEVMGAGIAPVLVSDDYALPPGPDWDGFLIRVRERDVAKLPEILLSQLPSAGQRGALAALAFQKFFSTSIEFDAIVDLAARSLLHGLPSEETFRKRQQRMIRIFQRKQKLRDVARTGFLAALRVLRLKNPYQLNR